MDPNRDRAHQAWRSAERIKRLSDRLIGIGPFGIGLDGALAWIPGANVLYSAGAGGLLLFEAVKAGASKRTLATMGLYLVADAATSEIPVAGWAVDTFFQGHLMAAKCLQKDIEARHGRPEAPSAWGRSRRADDPAPRPVRGTARFR